MNLGPHRRRLREKYASVLMLLLGGALLVSSLVDLYFSSQENLVALARLQRQEALDVAGRIEQFMRGVELQIVWGFQTVAAAPREEADDERYFDYLAVLRLTPAITTLRHLDATGYEQAHVSRLNPNTRGSEADFSRLFAEIDRWKLQNGSSNAYLSPMYFRDEYEPFITIGLAEPDASAGATVAEVNLTSIWDEISWIEVGRTGYAYVIDEEGRLVAHRDISRVLQRPVLSACQQVRSALDGGTGGLVLDLRPPPGCRSFVFTQHAALEKPKGWKVIVEQPLEEALAPVFGSAARTALFLLVGLVLARLASQLLADRLVTPIRALQAGAARIGGGELDQRIDVRTGDELEELGDAFNNMTAQLQKSHEELRRSHEELEQRVEQRTRELEGLGQVSQAVNSSLDLRQVLDEIVARAVELSGADGGAIYDYDEASGELRLQATQTFGHRLTDVLVATPLRLGEGVVGLAGQERRIVQAEDIGDEAVYRSRLRDLLLGQGYRALLAVPLLVEDRLLGGLVIARKAPGSFSDRVQALLRTFANHSALAIQNARLYSELQQTNRDLEAASRLKTYFVAMVSHELRNPLNMVLFNTNNAQMFLSPPNGQIPIDQVRDSLRRALDSGAHLGALIADLLDLSKIEAGLLTLSPSEVSLGTVARTVCANLQPLAAEKGLQLVPPAPRAVPTCWADEVRIAQVFRILVDNAIKFTDAGEVSVALDSADSELHVAVRDTGPGIPSDDLEKIFEAFHQARAPGQRRKGGTGLGLAIARRIVEAHSGRIWVESEPGDGATFRFTLPARAGREAGRGAVAAAP